MSGTARMPSHSATTGVDSSSISRCWRTMTSSRLFRKSSVVKSPSRSRSSVAVHSSRARPSASARYSIWRREKSGCLNEKMNVAVSVGRGALPRARGGQRGQHRPQLRPLRPVDPPAAVGLHGVREQSDEASARAPSTSARSTTPAAALREEVDPFAQDLRLVLAHDRLRACSGDPPCFALRSREVASDVARGRLIRLGASRVFKRRASFAAHVVTRAPGKNFQPSSAGFGHSDAGPLTRRAI